MYKHYILILLITLGQSCTSVTQGDSILNFQDNGAVIQFNYFANGHLEKEGYQFRVVEKDERSAGEIVRASDGAAWSGMYSNLSKPLSLSNGKHFALDVWMDHLGSFTLKLEGSKDGESAISVSVKNTKVNQWETLLFDFEGLTSGEPLYTKIALFLDIHTQATGKDVYSYFSDLRQIKPDQKDKIKGDKDKAIRIVVLGSSTAAGTGPRDLRNAWVNRYRKYLQAINGYHEVYNLAVGGYTTYHLLPSGTSVDSTRPQPDIKHNVTKALSLNPDAIIINLPSNDAARSFSVNEQLGNYQVILSEAAAANVPVWITTTQSRNLDSSGRQLLIDMRDSTYSNYGDKAIDFWSEIATLDGTINVIYDSGDGIHLNANGHKILFERVVEKGILELLY